MKIEKIEKLNEKVVFNISIEKEVWQKTILKQRENEAKRVKIPGFRTGKVPLNVALKSVSAESVLPECANKVINESLKNLDSEPEFKKIDLEVYPTPSIEIGKSFSVENFSFSVIYWVTPKVIIDNYKNLDVKLNIPTVDDKEVDAEIDNLLAKEKMLSAKDNDTVEKGDQVTFDFDGSVDGKPFAGGKAEKYSLEIGSNQFIPGFEDQMIGIKKDEQKELSVIFPKDYHAKEMAGKKAIFKVKIHEIFAISKPIVDEAFIKQLHLPDATIKTAAEFKKFLKENILKQKLQRANEQNIQQLNQAIVKSVKNINIPQVMIDDEKKQVSEQYDRRLKEMHFKRDDFLKMTGSDEATFDKQITEQARTNIIVYSAIEYIATKEKYVVTDADCEERYALLTKAYNQPIEDIKKYIQLDTIKEAILHEKVVFQLIEWNSKNSVKADNSIKTETDAKVAQKNQLKNK